jgi:hypothetical protein
MYRALVLVPLLVLLTLLLLLQLVLGRALISVGCCCDTAADQN